MCVYQLLQQTTTGCPRYFNSFKFTYTRPVPTTTPTNALIHDRPLPSGSNFSGIVMSSCRRYIDAAAWRRCIQLWGFEDTLFAVGKWRSGTTETPYYKQSRMHGTNTHSTADTIPKSHTKVECALHCLVIEGRFSFSWSSVFTITTTIVKKGFDMVWRGR